MIKFSHTLLHTFNDVLILRNFDLLLFHLMLHLVLELIHGRDLLIYDGLNRGHERHVRIVCHLFDM